MGNLQIPELSKIKCIQYIGWVYNLVIINSITSSLNIVVGSKIITTLIDKT